MSFYPCVELLTKENFDKESAEPNGTPYDQTNYTLMSVGFVSAEVAAERERPSLEVCISLEHNDDVEGGFTDPGILSLLMRFSRAEWAAFRAFIDEEMKAVPETKP